MKDTEAKLDYAEKNLLPRIQFVTQIPSQVFGR